MALLQTGRQSILLCHHLCTSAGSLSFEKFLLACTTQESFASICLQVGPACIEKALLAMLIRPYCDLGDTDCLVSTVTSLSKNIDVHVLLPTATLRCHRPLVCLGGEPARHPRVLIVLL